jgi:hypothetical protein
VRRQARRRVGGEPVEERTHPGVVDAGQQRETETRHAVERPAVHVRSRVVEGSHDDAGRRLVGRPHHGGGRPVRPCMPPCLVPGECLRHTRLRPRGDG